MKRKTTEKAATKNSKPGQSLIQLWVPTAFHTRLKVYAAKNETYVRRVVLNGIARETGISLLLLACVLLPFRAVAQDIGTPTYAPTKLEMAAQLTLSTGVALDIASSLTTGGCEMTALYRSADCTFGAKGTAIRAGMVVASLLLQRYVIKRVPRGHPARKVFTVMNFAGGAIGAGAAAGNWGRM